MRLICESSADSQSRFRIIKAQYDDSIFKKNYVPPEDALIFIIPEVEANRELCYQIIRDRAKRDPWGNRRFYLKEIKGDLSIVDLDDFAVYDSLPNESMINPGIEPERAYMVRTVAAELSPQV